MLDRRGDMRKQNEVVEIAKGSGVFFTAVLFYLPRADASSFFLFVV